MNGLAGSGDNEALVRRAWDRMANTKDRESFRNVTQAVPFLAVSDTERALRFYVDGLGFEISQLWIDEGTIRWCWLQRGGAALMLQDFRRENGKLWSPERALGLGVSIMFLCDDAVAIWREAARKRIQASRQPCGLTPGRIAPSS